MRVETFCSETKWDALATAAREAEALGFDAIERGLEAAGRPRGELDVCGGGFIATGPDEETVTRNRERIRYRVAFYASTRTYEPVMAMHGWEDLAAKLHQMSKTGQWRQMPAQVPDDVLDEFCVAVPYDDLPRAVEARFGGVSDTVELQLGNDVDPDQVSEGLERIRGLPQSFEASRPRFA